jgi:phage-related protein (TIGR01555 family)
LIRLLQSSEGMTILDSSDKFEVHQYAFGGLSDVLIQFGQQVSGAAQIPLVRLFGQSPAGLNATGDSDIRNYYDMINAKQEAVLRRPVRILLEVMCRSKFGKPLPKGFNFSFRPLWQLAENEKATAAAGAKQGYGHLHEHNRRRD